MANNLPYSENQLTRHIYDLNNLLLRLAIQYPYLEDRNFTKSFRGIRNVTTVMDSQTSLPLSMKELTATVSDVLQGAVSKELSQDLIDQLVEELSERLSNLNVTTRGNEEDLRYDSYCCMVFNMIETLYLGCIAKDADDRVVAEEMEKILFFREYLISHAAWWLYAVVREGGYDQRFITFVKDELDELLTPAC